MNGKQREFYNDTTRENGLHCFGLEDFCFIKKIMFKINTMASITAKSEFSDSTSAFST